MGTQKSQKVGLQDHFYHIIIYKAVFFSIFCSIVVSSYLYKAFWSKKVISLYLAVFFLIIIVIINHKIRYS